MADPGTLEGRTVGTIRIVERLGEGGMGRVYVGVDDKLGRRVAVKVIHPERRLDPRARSLFLREARILSQIEHPNVCRLYELLEDGEDQCLVLELVQGQSLRRRLDEGLSASQKKSIADQITAALVVAHSMSVVHRDLKPENIMVGDDGVVKVLDFGLARTVVEGEVETGSGGPAEGATAAAGPRQDRAPTQSVLMGTPRYMSPEQARGGPVTAASDMYSLGLILQELFGDRPPYGEGGAFSTLLHRARWGDVEPVSGVEDPQLASLLEELTSFQPQARPSAQVVAERLRSIWDRPRRRLRRLAISAVATLLFVAAVVSAVGFVQARRSQARAEASEKSALEAKAEADAINAFLVEMLTSANPRAKGIHVEVAEVLDDAAASLDRDTDLPPLVRSSVLRTLGSTWLALGDAIKAEDLFVQSLRTAEDALGAEHPATLESTGELARVLGVQGRLEESEDLLRKVLAVYESGRLEDDEVSVGVMELLSSSLQRRGRFDEAEALLIRVVEWRRSHYGPQHEMTLLALSSQAGLALRLGKVDQSEGLYRELLAAQRSLLGNEHPDTLNTLSNLAGILVREQGKYEEADLLLQELVTTLPRVVGAEHPRTIQALEHRAILLRRMGRNEESAQLWREILASRRRVLGEDHPSTITAHWGLAKVLTAPDQLDEAEALYRQALAVGERVLGEEHIDFPILLFNFANFLAEQHRYDEAEPLHRRVVEIQRRLVGDEHPKTLGAVNSLAHCLYGLGRLEEAEQLLRDVVARDREVLGDAHPTTLNALGNLALTVSARGDAEEAESLFRQGLDGARRTLGESHPLTMALGRDLAELLRRLGREEEAARLAVAGD